MRWTEEQYEEYLKRKGKTPEKPKKKKSKYNAKKTRVDGILFDSQQEANYYSALKLLLRVDEIRGFCLQPRFVLIEGNEEEQAITYRADFIVFHKDGTYEIIDTKGMETEQWKRTFKQFRLKYPKLELKVVKDNGVL